MLRLLVAATTVSALVLCLAPVASAQVYRWMDEQGRVYFELELSDAWVWDMYRPARFVANVRVVTFKDVNIEELARDA